MKPHLCANCNKHKALFFTSKDKRRRAKRDHELCQRCWRAAANRLSAAVLIFGVVL
jgi:hypothetical protein